MQLKKRAPAAPAGLRRVLATAATGLLASAQGYAQDASSDAADVPTTNIDAALLYYHENGRIQAIEPDLNLTQQIGEDSALSLIQARQDVPAPDLRTAMDPVKFRSTYITELKFDGSKLTVSGKGFGHGVGMPQWGAFQMASNGKKAEEIINYYFKGIDIVNLWNK